MLFFQEGDQIVNGLLSLCNVHFPVLIVIVLLVWLQVELVAPKIDNLECSLQQNVSFMSVAWLFCTKRYLKKKNSTNEFLPHKTYPY